MNHRLQDTSWQVRRCFLVLILGLFLPTNGICQAPPEETFGETYDVTVVELDVVVRDSRGRPVSGLSRDDFAVFEDGRERPIAGFNENTALTEEEDDSALDPGKMIFFLDEEALRPDRRARLLFFIQKYLSEIDPAEVGRVAYGVLSNRDALSVLVPLTGDRVRFLEAVAAMPPPSAGSARASIDRERLAEALSSEQITGGRRESLDQNCDASRLRLLGELSGYIDDVSRRNQRTIDSLNAAVTILGGIPGKKTLIYLGEGPELRPGEEMAYRYARRCGDSGLEVLSLAGESIASQLRSIAANANAYRVTIFAVDAAGSRLDQDLDPDVGQVRASNQQDSLHLLARESGGVLLRNVGDPSALLRRVHQELRAWYSVAYTPSPGVAGEIHAVDVQLRSQDHNGYQVSHRRAIRRIGRDEFLAAQILASLWLGTADNPLRAETSAEQSADGELRVAASVPFSALFLGPERPSTRLRIFLMARDADGKRRTPAKEHFESVHWGDGSESTFDFEVTMGLPTGTWNVAIGISDETTSRTSIRRINEVRVVSSKSSHG